MTTTEVISTILGSSLITGLLGWILGKRKEDIEVALKYQEFYKKHIDDLTLKIEGLESKVEMLLEQDALKSKLIDEQRLNLLKWEENCIRLEHIIKEKDRQIAKLVNE